MQMASKKLVSQDFRDTSSRSYKALCVRLAFFCETNHSLPRQSCKRLTHKHIFHAIALGERGKAGGTGLFFCRRKKSEHGRTAA